MPSLERARPMFTVPGSPLTASMLRDIEARIRPKATISSAISCAAPPRRTIVQWSKSNAWYPPRIAILGGWRTIGTRALNGRRAQETAIP